VPGHSRTGREVESSWDSLPTISLARRAARSRRHRAATARHRAVSGGCRKGGGWAGCVCRSRTSSARSASTSRCWGSASWSGVGGTQPARRTTTSGCWWTPGRAHGIRGTRARVLCPLRTYAPRLARRLSRGGLPRAGDRYASDVHAGGDCMRAPRGAGVVGRLGRAPRACSSGGMTPGVRYARVSSATLGRRLPRKSARRRSANLRVPGAAHLDVVGFLKSTSSEMSSKSLSAIAWLFDSSRFPAK
jgi:hypothetical protein